jgi:hypothetical protein
MGNGSAADDGAQPALRGHSRLPRTFSSWVGIRNTKGLGACRTDPSTLIRFWQPFYYAAVDNASVTNHRP